MKTLICIPAHNEEDNIAEIIRACQKYGEVLVIDDGSTDNTFEIALQTALVIHNPPGSQYGDGFIQGCEWALYKNGIQVVFMNAGGSHFPEDIPRLLKGLEGNDMVIGSRILRHSVCRQPLIRRPLTYLATRFLGLLVGEKRVDYSSFRAFNYWAMVVAYDLAKSLPKETRLFNPLLTYKLYKSGLKIKQAPISYRAINNQLHLEKFIQVAWILLKYMIRSKRLNIGSNR